MAEINIAVTDRRKAGVRRMKRHSLKTDMTPMVDLGFLLISFFVITAEMSKPRATDLFMPRDSKNVPPNQLGKSNAMTVLLGKDNAVYYYMGKPEEAFTTGDILRSDFSVSKGVGNVIRNKQQWLDQHPVNGEGRKGLMVLIKPTAYSTYNNVVNMLDEMLINKVDRYALLKPSLAEADFMSKMSQ